MGGPEPFEEYFTLVLSNYDENGETEVPLVPCDPATFNYDNKEQVRELLILD